MVVVSGTLLPVQCEQSQDRAQSSVSTKTEESEQGYCHRCGMFVDPKTAIRVTQVPVGPWLQCCPVCALLDILEGTENGTGRIIAHCDVSGATIEVTVMEKTVTKVNPPESVILFGGTCITNKTFFSRQNAEKFVSTQSWAEDKPVRNWQEMLDSLVRKTKQIDRCTVCTASLKGHEKTWFTVLTKDKKRKICCCAHCGIFLYLKEREKIRSMVTADYKTLKQIDASDAFYVVGHDQVTCCVPATAAFQNKGDALDFQQEHGGKVYTLQEAVANIEQVMKVH